VTEPGKGNHRTEGEGTCLVVQVRGRDQTLAGAASDVGAMPCVGNHRLEQRREK
jgi:hypothetical protein